MGKRVSIALGLLLGIGITYEVVTSGPGADGFSFTHHRRAGTQPGQVFAFAPANGAGMGAVCACSSVTGTRGEAITFTRASSSRCLKGPQWAGIANGDMVTCGVDQPVVMPGGDGTGPLGLYVAPAEVSVARASEDFSDSTWLAFSHGDGTDPTVTVDQTIAPDGTLTADKVHLSATTVAGSGISEMFGNGQPSATAKAACVFAKGVGGDGGTCLVTGDGVTTTCRPFNYVSTSWTLVSAENIGNITAYAVGNNSLAVGGVDFAAQDVYLWGFWAPRDHASCLDYIKTTNANGSRAADSASASVTTAHEQLLFSADAIMPTVTGANVFDDYQAAGDRREGEPIQSGAKLTCDFIESSVSHAITSAAAWTPHTKNTLACRYVHPEIAGQLLSCVNGTCTDAGYELAEAAGSRSFFIGSGSGSGFELGGVVKNVFVTDTAAPKATAWISDSITQVSSAVFFYSLDTKRVVDDYGVGGSSWSQCAAQWTNNKKQRDTRLVVECGINDIGGGANGTTLAGQEIAFVDARAGEGIPTAWFNLMPFEDAGYYTGARNTERQTFNTLFQAHCDAGVANLTCFNSEAAVWDPASHNKLLPAYNSGDDLHPNSPDGGQALATGLENTGF